MILDDAPIFGMLRQKLGYLNERERLISENIANSNTPGFRPSDLKAFTFRDQLAKTSGGGAAAGGGLAPAISQSGHMAAPTARPASPYKATKGDDSEVTLDGNAVVLEDQVMRMTESRMDFDAAVGFYQKAMAMVRMAARRPGG